MQTFRLGILFILVLVMGILTGIKLAEARQEEGKPPVFRPSKPSVSPSTV